MSKHAQWDALLADIERQLEEQRSIQPRRLMIEVAAIGGLLLGIGAALGMLTVHLLRGG